MLNVQGEMRFSTRGRCVICPHMHERAAPYTANRRLSVHVYGSSSVHTCMNVPHRTRPTDDSHPVYTYLQYVIFRLYNRKPWLQGIVGVRLIKRKQKAKNVLDKPYIFRIHLLFLVCPNRKLLQLGSQIWVIILFVLATKIQKNSD